MPNKSPRKFSREFKLEAVRRILAGEQVRALSEELTVLRKDLYAWRKLFRAGGVEALRPLGRPRKGDGVVVVESEEASRDAAAGDTGAPERDCRARAQDRPAAGRTRFFSASLAAGRGGTPAERRAWRDGVFAVIQAMTIPAPQGELTIERMCVLAGVSRAGYYRHWAASAPARGGDRRCATRSSAWRWRTGITAIAGSRRCCGAKAGAVNHKRVLRLMQQDNLLCLRQKPFVPATTDSRHGWRVVPNLARGLVPRRPRPALGGRHHLYPAAGGVRLSGRRARRLQPPGRRLGPGDASGGELGARRALRWRWRRAGRRPAA